MGACRRCFVVRVSTPPAVGPETVYNRAQSHSLCHTVMSQTYYLQKVLLCTGHPFCRECLSRWQATSHLCPVCRADQRTLSGTEPGTDVPQEEHGQQDPSLTNILGLIGQLLAQSQGTEDQYPPSFHSGGRQAQFAWHFGSGGQPSGAVGQQEHPTEAEPASSNTIDINELQSSLQFVLVRINSLERRPLYWSAQVEELQSADAQLDRCRQGTVANPQQVAEQIQAYVDTANAQLDEFLTQAEARQQQERQQASFARQHAQPSAPPLGTDTHPHASAPGSYASSPPHSDQHTASQTPTAGPGGAWQWKWGWGSAPAGTLPDDSPSNAQSNADSAQQAVGTGLTNAASAAASAASAIYRRFTAAVRAGAAPTRSESAQSEAQHAQQATNSGLPRAQPSGPRQQPHASSSSSNPGQAPRSNAQEEASATGSDGLPVGRAYEAIRNIFDQHVDPQSRLGQWGTVAQHLSNLHAEMNPADRQQQDAGRMLAAAVNAYTAYRRASAASQQL